MARLCRTRHPGPEDHPRRFPGPGHTPGGDTSHRCAQATTPRLEGGSNSCFSGTVTERRWTAIGRGGRVHATQWPVAMAVTRPRTANRHAPPGLSTIVLKAAMAVFTTSSRNYSRSAGVLDVSAWRSGIRLGPHITQVPQQAGSSPSPSFRDELTKGEDRIEPATWAGGIPPSHAIAPRFRVGRRWFWLLIDPIRGSRAGRYPGCGARRRSCPPRTDRRGRR